MSDSNTTKSAFDPDARCHWRGKDTFFPTNVCRHAFKTHVDGDRHVDENCVGIGTACRGGYDDDEDTWCNCPGFEPSPDFPNTRRFPDAEDEQREKALYEKAMRGE